LNKAYKKKIIITGGRGLLGSNFYIRYKKKFNIIRYPYRIEHFSKFQKWIRNKDFDYFIHFAALTKSESIKRRKSLNLINVKSTLNIIESLNRENIKNFKYFLFISSSHVYGTSSKKIKENKKTTPNNSYGLSKKKVEDFIFKNRKKYKFKIGVARVFNSTGPKQKIGNFVPDMIKKIKKNNFIDNVNQYRDFIHIDDVMDSLMLLIKKKFYRPINISSGKKINLTQVCKIINQTYVKKNIIFGKKRGKDLYGDNKLLKSIGKRKFNNIYQIIKSFKK
tara:strand:+ start:6472 stop:7305 length:834 start_codon:yes stop_codon:yes gene_type:complete